MHGAANSVSAVAIDDKKLRTELLLSTASGLFEGIGDIGKQIAWNHSLHALHKDILGGLIEGLDIWGELAHGEGPGAIADPAVERSTTINGD